MNQVADDRFLFTGFKYRGQRYLLVESVCLFLMEQAARYRKSGKTDKADACEAVADSIRTGEGVPQ